MTDSNSFQIDSTAVDDGWSLDSGPTPISTPDGLYLSMDAGIRDLVRSLRLHGFMTTDSGDGIKAGAMSCAIPCRNIAMQTHPCLLVSESDRLRSVLIGMGEHVTDIGASGWSIEASYDPVNGAAFILMYEDDGSAVAEFVDGVSP